MPEFKKKFYSLLVMPDSIRHPEIYNFEIHLDSPSTVLRVVSLSNHCLRIGVASVKNCICCCIVIPGLTRNPVAFVSYTLLDAGRVMAKLKSAD